MNPGVAAARFLTNSPLRTAALGAGVGAAAGGLRPQEGETRGQAMARGALRGGALAGGAAALGRGYRDTRLLNPDMSATQAIGGTAKRMGQGLVNFGKRQVHGVTGAFDHDTIGMAGNARAASKAKLLDLRKADEIRHAPIEKAKGIQSRYAGQIESTLAEGRAAQNLADANITTLPGIAKSLAKKETRGKALRAMGKTITDGPGGAVMALGVPLATSAPTLLRGDESAKGGLTTGQKVRNLGVSVAAGTAFGGMPIIPQMAAGMGVDYGLSRLSKLKTTPRHALPLGPAGEVPPGART